MEPVAKIEPVRPMASVSDAAPDPELIDYLLVLWRWKALIVLGTVLAAATALAVSFIIPKTYEATAKLMVTRSKFGSDQLLGPQQVALTAKTYEGIIKNPGALTDAIEKFKLAAPPYELKMRDVDRAVAINVVKDTSLLDLSVEMREPQLAADVANFFASRAIDLNNQLNEGEIGESRGFLDAQVQRKATTLHDAEDALENFERDADLEIVRKQQEICLTRLGELHAQRTKVDTDLADANGDLVSLEKDLGQQPKTLKTANMLVEDSAYQQAVGKLSRSDLDALLAMNMQHEELNPTYTFLQQKLTETRRDVSGLTARKHELDVLLAQNDKDLDRLQNELTEKNTALERLKRTYELERDSYKLLRSRLDAANVEVVSKTSLLKVVDAALPPQRHIKPRKALNTALGGAAGFLGMVMLAFLSDYVERARPR